MEALELAHTPSNTRRRRRHGPHIFQSDSPVGMIKPYGRSVHENVSVKEAYKIYESEKAAWREKHRKWNFSD